MIIVIIVFIIIIIITSHHAPDGLYPPLETLLNAAAATPPRPLTPLLYGVTHVSHAPGQTNSPMDFKIQITITSPGGARYCDKRVCVSKTTGRSFTKFSVRVICARGSVLL